MGKQQQELIDYLFTENAVLREKLGGGRIVLNDDQRRRLAVKGKVLGRKRLSEIRTLFTPDTILRWHRQLVAKKWDYSDRKEKKSGRPRIRQVIVDLTVKFAKENPMWGYDRISGALANVGNHICDSTIGNILKAHGIEPVPTRRRTGSWEIFLKSHWDVIAATDFTTVEVWTKGGLTTFYLLFVMELKTRRVNFAGCTANPNEAWMQTIARELTNHEDGFLNEKKYLIMDRDATFSKSFRACLQCEGGMPVRLPPRSPNLNAHLERFFGTLKSECLHKLILFGETATRKAVRSFLEHYHTERNHQGLGNELIVPMDRPTDLDAKIETTERLGGLLRSYRRAA
ncbi:Integrase core domain protein [Rubripirellula amarantea]|uniref:Integrase core domain protein n=1 Tax=Rubripirellula amarantea TaxID=2527999 RepID=A0A5C5WXQ4_9BACT|nr:integrase core domain-containing protein [Rubripirellula amarantea]TWT54783.1 Integrase core domain protein [Rubripirellula amarantea]